MRSIVLASISVALAGCAFPKSETEIKASLAAHIRCARAEIPRLDDGRSDARTVAEGADARCGKEWAEYVETAMHQYGPTDRARLTPAVREKSLQHITADVLAYRTARR